MGYLIYIVGLAVCIIMGIGWANIMYFMDVFSLGFVLIPCIFVLACTGYGKSFIKAFHCVFDKEGYTKEMAEDCGSAVKYVCMISLLFGGMGVVISSVNALHNLNDILDICRAMAVAFVPAFYALAINAALAPLYFWIKRIK